jgi:phytoene synthase
MSLAIATSRAVIAQHSKSFALASRLLPTEGRDEASIVYAYCRRADDAVDLVPASQQGLAVARLRRELDAVYSGEALAEPVLAAFQSVVRSRKIPREYPDELLCGMEMDAVGTTYENQTTLLSYCFRVAGTVGLMMSHVMGVRDPAALLHAAHLGMGMQLTNIARDVGEDWQRGRLYLPRDLLAAAGAPDIGARLGEAQMGEALLPSQARFPGEARRAAGEVTLDLLRRADDFYRSGDEGIAYLSFRSAIAVRTARLVYADIGRIVRAQKGDPWAARAVVSTPRKLWLACVAFGKTRPSAPFTPAPLERPLGFCDVVPV